MEFGEGFFKGTFYIQIGRNAALLIEVVKGKYLLRPFQFEIVHSKMLLLSKIF